MNAILTRETFATSRTLEYFSEKELQTQIGFGPAYWPVAILRELIDNALDACEEAGVPPDVKITTEDDTIVVTDNGPGIPRETIVRSLDYMVRVSSKAAYVSPTRGSMGNALKVMWAAPFVATGSSQVEIESRGELNLIKVSLDRISGRPEISHDTVKIDEVDDVHLPRARTASGSETVRSRTSVRIRWPESTRLLNAPDLNIYRPAPSAADLVATYAAFNPHSSFTLDGVRYPRSIGDWSKWNPAQPTSAHWYTQETLRDLIAACIAKDMGVDAERTVRDFVGGFRGLSGTVKRKVVTEGWSGQRLRDFVVEGDVDPTFVRELLNRMRAECSPPSPKVLGAIGKEHLTKWMMSQGIAEDSIRYIKKVGAHELPFVLEVAFGINNDDDSNCRVVSGLNWSPTLGGDPIQKVRDAVADARLDTDDPVTLIVHIAQPRFTFADRGKTRLAVSRDLAAGIAAAIKSVASSWKQAKRSADRNDHISRSRIAHMRRRKAQTTIRDVAFRVMEDAYNKASANGKFYANARQIMYAARPSILAEIDAAEFNDVYFTQTLLKDYLEEFKPDWKVVWDSRGNLVEPHTGRKVSLGGTGVRQYVENWHSVISTGTPNITARIDTDGPNNRFGSVLFIEKEGFAEILSSAGIGSRYDMAIMSTKGNPVKAACDVIEAIHQEGVKIFVLHDFDLAGFKIARTLREGTRLATGSPVIDLGLRLADIQGLPSEPVSYSQKTTPKTYLLRDCGVTKEEVDFLVSGGHPGRWTGKRVEINAMTSEQLISWLERKFAEFDIKKVVPDAATLSAAYQRARFLKRLEAEIAELERGIHREDVVAPRRLGNRVKELLATNPGMSWDDAVWEFAGEAHDC